MGHKGWKGWKNIYRPVEMKKILGGRGGWEYKYLIGYCWVMHIPNIDRYLLNIFVESVLQVFKHFKSLQVWSLGVVF